MLPQTVTETVQKKKRENSNKIKKKNKERRTIERRNFESVSKEFFVSQEDMLSSLKEQETLISEFLSDPANLPKLCPKGDCSEKEQAVLDLLFNDLQLSKFKAQKVWEKIHEIFQKKGNSRNK
jgi:hypothetical protein